ncbi:hypothetical protein [Bartonella mastomydis]|nr:hypothetical protein [Bartonella mastomydis]
MIYPLYQQLWGLMDAGLFYALFYFLDHQINLTRALLQTNH